jgi:hypothetical protein
MATQASSDLKLKAVKHYFKVNNYVEVCKILRMTIIKIILFMLTTKIIIKINKQVKNHQNTENLKFINIKNRHLKYAPL